MIIPSTDVINYGITDNQSMIDAILKETLPLLPVHMKAPNYGFSAFATVSDRDPDGPQYPDGPQL